MRSSVLRVDDDVQIFSPEEEERVKAAFGRIPSIEAAVDQLRSGVAVPVITDVAPSMPPEACDAAAQEKIRRYHLDAHKIEAAIDLLDAADRVRADEEKGEMQNKNLTGQTEKTVIVDKRKDAEGEGEDKLQKIMDAITSMGTRFADMNARLDSLEGKKSKADSKRKDGEEEPEEGEDQHEKEKAREVAAHGDSIDPVTEFRLKCEKPLASVGLETGKPLIGETARSYAERMLRPIKKYSKRFGKISLSELPDAAFSAVADDILASTEQAGYSGAFVTGGDGIVEVKRKDNTGRPISMFYSSNGETFIRSMKRPARFVRAFNLPSGSGGGFTSAG
jgi:hypothetical protein